MQMRKLTEYLSFIPVLAAAADRFASDPVSTYVSMAKYGHAAFLVAEGAGGTGTATLTVLAASDNSGTGAEAIAFKYRLMSTIDTMGALQDATASGVTPAAGANKMTVIEIDAVDLPRDKPFVAVKATESVDSPVAASIMAVLSDARYAESVMPTALT
jgi:hypothetical protein